MHMCLIRRFDLPVTPSLCVYLLANAVEPSLYASSKHYIRISIALIATKVAQNRMMTDTTKYCNPWHALRVNNAYSTTLISLALCIPFGHYVW